MSVLGKNWRILNTSGAPLERKLLKNRGLKTQREINEFLEPEKYGRFHDPYKFGGMKKAVSRIREAVDKKERIIVFGDYDVDGISGTAILVKTLRELGANVSYRLPHRVMDGYGLKEKFIKEFAPLGIKLVITVDCGISCGKEIELAAKNEIDVIITDHHAIPKKPPKKALVIIHPLLSNYPFKHLTGAGIALKLAEALKKGSSEKFLDLAALGTVSDIGLLTGENRLIVKKGLQRLAATNLEGLRFLKEIAGISDEKIDTHTIGFQIGPRINAAGRIDNPYFALQLLLNENKEKGKRLAEKLEQLNRKRQEMTRKAFEEAEKYFKGQKKSILIKEDKNWHVGILGLIAGKLCEKYSLPSIILQDFGEYLTASARSPNHFNIIKAITKHAGFLTYFGGHAQAAGFEILRKNYGKFKKAIEKYAAEKLNGKDIRPVLKIECEIQDDDINSKTIDFLESMKPFGEGNEPPNFLLKNLTLHEIREVGKDKSHLKISGKSDKQILDIIAFGFAQHADALRRHKKIDLVCNIEKNTRRGFEGIQLKAADFRNSK